MSLAAEMLRVGFRLSSVVPGMRRRLQPHLPEAEVKIDGHRFILSPSDNYVDYKMWSQRRPYEAASLRLLAERTAGKRALFCDIGANIGLYSVMIGAGLGPGSRRIAVEPNPTLVARLRRNLSLNGIDTEIAECALGDSEGVAQLTLANRDLGGASLRPDRSNRKRKDRWGETIEVPLRQLASLIADTAAYEVFLIKIDVEGMEDAVLCPFLAQGRNLPDHILIEDANQDMWAEDLLGALSDTGFAPAAHADGNTLYSRQPRPS